MDWALIAPGLLAGALVMLTHAPLGHEVLKRGVIFIDLAIAQFAAVGLVVGTALEYEPHSWELQLTALCGALVGALLIAVMERHVRQQEAMIGILFVLAATFAVFISDFGAQGAQQLKELLSGQILFIEYEDLWPAVVMAVLMVMITAFKPLLLEGRFFYVLFALALTVSVQHVGVYLVFASLIIPAYVTLVKRRIGTAVLIGVAAYVVGLCLSLLTDWLAGPLIVWSMAVFALVFRMSMPQQSA